MLNTSLLHKLHQQRIPPPDFQVNLVTDNILSKGNGAATYTGATTKTIKDFEGLLKLCKISETDRHGARRVENLIANSENFGHASWSKISVTVTSSSELDPIFGNTAYRIVGTGISALTTNVPTPAGNKYIISAYVKSATGANQTFRLVVDGIIFSPNLTATNVWQRFSLIATTPGSGSGNLGILRDSSNNSFDVLLWGTQLEVVTGQTNQNPSEYISNGVISAPYHGTNVDGVKYFTTENGNTVVSNVVTEATGPVIAANTLKGYLSEGQRINLCLQSQTMSTWTDISTPTITSANKNYGALVLDLLGDDDALVSEGKSRVVTFTGNAQKSVSVFIKKGTATKSDIKLRDTTALADRLNVEVTWSGTVPVLNFVTGTQEREAELFKDDVYRIFCLTTSVTAANGNQIECYPASDNMLSITDTGDINIGGFQVEDALFASSYIPTTTTTATRNLDALTYPFAGNFNNSSGSCYFEILRPASSNLANNDILYFGEGGPVWLWGNNDIRVFDGTNFYSSGILVTAGTAMKLGAKWSDSQAKTINNGVFGASSSYDKFFGNVSLRINATAQLFANVKNVKIWKRALSDRQLQRLTL